jgi:hypothetical protein
MLEHKMATFETVRDNIFRDYFMMGLLRSNKNAGIKYHDSGISARNAKHSTFSIYRHTSLNHDSDVCKLL